MRFVLKVIDKYIFRNKKYFSNFISVFSIAIGSAIIICMFFIFMNLKNDMTKKILGFFGHITLVNNKGNIENYQDSKVFLNSIIQSIKLKNSDLDVKHIFPTIKQQVVIAKDKRATGAILNGVQSEDLNSRPIIGNSLPASVKSKFNNKKNVIILGKDLMKKIGAKVGDKIGVICPTTKVIDISTTKPKVTYCVIIGFFDAKIQEYNESFAFVNLVTAQNMMAMNDNLIPEVTNIEIFMKNPTLSNVLSNKINLNLKKSNIHSGDLLETYDWKSVNKNFLEAINMQLLIMIMIFLFIIIMTSLSIISNIIHLSDKKRREIAILRTIGASKLQILILFFMIGNVLSILGLCAGVLISYVFLKNINFIIKIISYIFADLKSFIVEDISFDLLLVMKICFVIFIIISFSSIYPAFKAANFSPSESLKDD